MKKIFYLIVILFIACIAWQCGKKGDDANSTPEPTLSLTNFVPARDTVGANIVLTGTAFSTVLTDNKVMFNGTLAQVTNATATSITVKVPTGATKGKITVEANGKTATSTNDFTVTGWERKADYGGVARAMGSGFVLNGKIYYGLGIRGYAGANVNGSGEFWEYDPATNVWTQKATFTGTGISGGGTTSTPVSFAINGKGYVALGSMRAVWEYDPIANTWTKKNETHPIGTTTSLQDAFAFVVNNKAYVGGGYNGTAKRDLYEYDPVANTWTKKADFPETSGIYRVQGFAIGTKGYVGAGVVSSGTKRFWEYDVTANSWREIASYPANSGADAVATTMNGKGYVYTWGFGLYEYDPSTNTWATKKYTPPMSHFVALPLGERIYWVGGNGGVTKDFWSYIP